MSEGWKKDHQRLDQGDERSRDSRKEPCNDKNGSGSRGQLRNGRKSEGKQIVDSPVEQG